MTPGCRASLSRGTGTAPRSRFASTPKLLAAAESEDPKATRKDAAEELRKIVSTIGAPGEPGEHIRCVVSVNMLSEGRDASNVTQILGAARVPQPVAVRTSGRARTPAK